MTLEQDTLAVHYLEMQDELKAPQWGRQGGICTTTGALELLVTNVQTRAGNSKNQLLQSYEN